MLNMKRVLGLHSAEPPAMMLLSLCTPYVEFGYPSCPTSHVSEKLSWSVGMNSASKLVRSRSRSASSNRRKFGFSPVVIWLYVLPRRDPFVYDARSVSQSTPM